VASFVVRTGAQNQGRGNGGQKNKKKDELKEQKNTRVPHRQKINVSATTAGASAGPAPSKSGHQVLRKNVKNTGTGIWPDDIHGTYRTGREQTSFLSLKFVRPLSVQKGTKGLRTGVPLRLQKPRNEGLRTAGKVNTCRGEGRNREGEKNKNTIS